jgi:hypothetical protein
LGRASQPIPLYPPLESAIPVAEHRFSVFRHADSLFRRAHFLAFRRANCHLFYGGNLIAVGLVLYAIWAYATRGRRLVDKDLPREALHRASQRILIAPCVFVVAIALGLFNTKASLILYAATASYYFFSQPHRSALEKESRRRVTVQIGVTRLHQGPFASPTRPNSVCYNAQVRWMTSKRARGEQQ